MNILNLGSSFLAGALRARGHQVLTVGLTGDCDVRIVRPITIPRLEEHLAGHGFTPDCALWVDNGNLPFLMAVEELPYPSVFYAIDTFCNPWHVPFAYAFDGVLEAQKEYAALFPQPPALPEAAAWLPLFAPDDLADLAESGTPEEREIPVAFVGTLRPRNIPQRIVFLQEFKRLNPLFMMEGAYRPVFAKARIVLNQSAAGEVNFRCFEAMACGAALLTEHSEQGLADLFTPGVHILPPYRQGDAAHAASIAREWLARPEELAAVAATGRELVLRRHLASHRAAYISDILERYARERTHESRLRDLPRRRMLLATAYGILADELSAPEMADLSRLFRRRFAHLSGELPL